MNNKVLIKLIVPELDTSFDIFIPVNEVIWRIRKLLVKSISDLTNITLGNESNYVLINKSNSHVYSNNDIVINTDIRNGTELLLIMSNFT